MQAKILPIVGAVLLVGLAGAAVWTLRPASNPPMPSANDLAALGIDAAELGGKVRHEVTAQMELESRAMANRLAPAFEREDAFGKSVKVGPGDRPQFVVFIKKGCPCSFEAQPLFNRLSRKHRDIDFVGVIDKEGKAFSNQLSVVFPVVEEPSKALMKAYDARASVYCALVARNGHIVKMWPGYSASWLKEIDRLMSQATGTKPTPFDPQYAPLEKASGCSFSD